MSVMVPLSRFITQIKDGTHGTHQRVDEGVPLLSAKNVFNHGLVVGDEESLIDSTEAAVIIANGFPRKGDVLLTTVGTIGRSTVWNEDIPRPFQRSVSFIRLDKRQNPKFFKYYFESKYFQDQLGLLTKVSAQPGIYMGDIKTIPVPFLELDEQNRVASKIESKVKILDKMIAIKIDMRTQLKELRTVIIANSIQGRNNNYNNFMQTGVEWIGSIPAHWEVRRLKTLSRIRRGASPRPIDDPRYFDENGDYAWVRIADVTRQNKYLKNAPQKLSLLGKSLSVPLEPGELFLSIAASVGKPMISGIKCCIHDGFIYFENPQINREYLYYVFEAGEAYKGLGKLGTQLNLNSDSVGNIRIPVPPQDEQDAIVKEVNARLETHGQALHRLDESIRLYEEYRSSLVSDVFVKKVKS